MVRRVRCVGRLLWLAASLLVAQCPAHATQPCDGVVAHPGAPSGGSRPIEADDLLRLRDIGYSHLAPGQRILALSPDKRSVAFSMFRASPANNAYCEGIFVLDRVNKAVRTVDTSDGLILEAREIRGVKVDYGYPQVILPEWSPDGRQLAYLKRSGGRIQVWAAPASGGSPIQVSRASVDVDRFMWSADGAAILYTVRPAIAERERAIEKEGLTGFLFDERVVPYSSAPRPAARLPAPEEFWYADMLAGVERRATASEISAFPPLVPADPTYIKRSAATRSGQRAWTAAQDPDAYLSTVDLWAQDQAGKKRRCIDPACAGARLLTIQQMWWTPDGKDVLFIKRSGWAGSQMGLYRWHPGALRVHHIVEGNDLLIGCEPLKWTLVCLREGSTKPRRIVAIDIRTGREAILHDPNPDFASIALGPVERLHWRGETGAEVFADLVLPPDGNRRGPLPLIVVQYTSMGFLRGGIGDEYPIQLFAKAGYAVLSFHAPFSFPKWDGTKKNNAQAIAQTSAGWETRKIIADALERGITLLADRGVIDLNRVGLSGVSDGATTIEFLLIRNKLRYATASVGSCCIDPTSFMIFGGIGLETERRAWGFPPARGAGSEGWLPASLALNAAKIKTPYLMQLADNEYRTGLDTFMSLRGAGNPTEMIIYPNEYHLMWQPAHRAAAYRRNLDWFDFWLRHQENAAPLDPAQYGRWRAMKAGKSPD